MSIVLPSICPATLMTRSRCPFTAHASTPLLTNDSTNGFATTVDLNANGAVVNNLSSQVAVAATPIPAAVWLLGSGLMGLAGIRRRMAA